MVGVATSMRRRIASHRIETSAYQCAENSIDEIARCIENSIDAFHRFKKTIDR